MYFSESHEWIDEKKTPATIGVTDFAQSELGDIVYVELPEVGKEVKQGEELAVLESTKAAADVYAPVSGIIKEVNTKLESDPGLINHSPRNEGWIVKIELKNKEELSSLMDETAYQLQLNN